MDKIYTFSWLLNFIDNGVIFMLYNHDNLIACYQVSSILNGEMDVMKVKFANIDDLDKFVNFGIVRFTDVSESTNIIDIPVRNLYLFYKNSNGIETINRKKVKLADLDSFAVINGQVIKEDYMIEIVNLSDVSDELSKLMKIMYDYSSMSMNEKINALEDVNLINYRMDKQLEECV